MKDIVKYIREKTSLTQEELANILGTTSVTVSRWENGKTVPNLVSQKLLFDICEKENIDMQTFLTKKYRAANTNGKLILYHGSRTGIKGEIAPISRSKCDFGKGFYMGTDPLQPLTLICTEEKPFFYVVELDTDNIKILDSGTDLDWAMMIAYHRRAMEDFKNSAIYNKFEHISDGYDIITGYIANDKMYDVLQSFFRGEITDVALIKCLSVLDLGKQFVAVTQKGCNSIKILKETKLSYFEQLCLQKISRIRRQEAIELTEQTKRDYRREGKYFDEILKAGEF